MVKNINVLIQKIENHYTGELTEKMKTKEKWLNKIKETYNKVNSEQTNFEY